MGSAIAERIKSQYEVFVFDKDKDKTKKLPEIKCAESIADLIEKVDAVVLAVKPQDFDGLLSEVKGLIKDKLVITIAAGITTGYIEKYLGSARVIRVMSNLGVKIGKAESGLCKGSSPSDKDLDFVKELFNYAGKTWVVKEEMIDVITAISGSGLAYIYYDMEMRKINPSDISEDLKQEYITRLTKAAQKLGLDSITAVNLATATTDTALQLTLVTAISPLELRKKITSKGGTTAAAVKVLAGDGSWEDAAIAAKRRAEELSKKE